MASPMYHQMDGCFLDMAKQVGAQLMQDDCDLLLLEVVGAGVNGLLPTCAAQAAFGSGVSSYGWGTFIAHQGLIQPTCGHECLGLPHVGKGL